MVVEARSLVAAVEKEMNPPTVHALSMALSATQRRRLPDSAFAYPSTRSYPIPTKAQATRAGISESQRIATLRSALSRSAQKGTSGSYSTVARKVAARAGGKIASVRSRRR